MLIMSKHRLEKYNYVVVVTCFMLFLLAHCFDQVEGKRNLSGNSRKTSSSGGGHSTRHDSGHVTKPTYNTNSGTSGSSNSHADLAKLSYSNYNSQPNRPAAAGTSVQNPAPIGWNVPKQQGPPPAYSPSNPVGGAKTNPHDNPPAYHPNNAPPPSYGASGTNVHTPITATNTHGLQSGYPSQSGGAYYPPNGQLPAGASYPSSGHLPAGSNYYPGSGHPAGATYYPSGGQVPAGATYYPSGGYQHVPAGATYIPAGAALPAGATYYSQPPQSSSGLGFGSGLAAGAIGGAILGHVLTPTQTRVVEQAPAATSANSGGGEDRIIIINNGQPGTVNATQLGSGTTVITTGGGGGAAAPIPPAGAVDTPNTNADATAPLAPIAAMNPSDITTMRNETAAQPAPEQQPPAGGIICVPVSVNDTDPANNSKMIEVQKIACYPAPPAPAAPPAPSAPEQQNNNANGDAPAPLAPLNPLPDKASQQLQQNPNQSGVLRAVDSGVDTLKRSMSLLIGFMGLLLANGMY